MSEKQGTIVQVMGPVVDVAFPAGSLPALQDALALFGIFILHVKESTPESPQFAHGGQKSKE